MFLKLVIFQELDASGEVDLKRAKVFWFREPAAGCKCLPQIWTTGAISYTTLNRILTVSLGENEARGWRRNPNRCHTCHPESLINMEIYTANLHETPELSNFCKRMPNMNVWLIIFAAMTNFHNNFQWFQCPASSQNLASGCTRCSRYTATLWLPAMSAWLRLDHAPFVERNAAD